MRDYTNNCPTGLISYNGLVGLVNDGALVGVPPENINGSSIDITLDDTILIEKPYDDFLETYPPVNPVDKENLSLTEKSLLDEPFNLWPGQFILASTQEVFNLPANVSAEYKLKSSLARVGLNHMLAGWCDPHWSNSKLTLELVNSCQRHVLKLERGMKIGQIVFWQCEPVPEKAGYSARGQYNNQTGATASKGVK